MPDLPTLTRAVNDSAENEPSLPSAVLPFTSIIIPCRNEEKYIGACLDSVLANDFPKERLEVLVVDGMSCDKTRTIVERFVRTHPPIRLLDNPRQITPVALNIGIKAARGEIIVRLDAHAHYERDYVSRCVESLGRYEVENVGGVMKTLPREDALISRAIALGLSHGFGVGPSYFRIHSTKPRGVDTVFGGCYRKKIFERLGLFNEALARGQDMEFNLRLKAAGGRTLIVPDIVSNYYPPATTMKFISHTFRNGVWAIIPFLYSEIIPVSWRHLVPLAFVLSLVGSVVLSLAWPSYGGWLLAGIAGAYVAVNIIASVHVAVRERDIRYPFVMSFIFAILHLGYGLGSLWGLVKALGTVIANGGLKRTRQAARPC